MNTDINLSRKIGEGVTAEIFAWGENQVLKLFWANRPRKWIAWEAFYTKVAYDHGLPVPPFWDLTEVNGRNGIIYDRIDGPSASTCMAKNPLRVSKWAKMLAELLASVHSIDISRVEIDGDFFTQKKHFEHYIENAAIWTDTQRNKVIKAMNNLPDGNSLCHGDFHLNNIIMSADGPVIIDWPTASRGNPWGDVAVSSALILSDPHPKSAPTWLRVLHRTVAHRINKIFLKTYLSLRPDRDNQLNKWLICAYVARVGDMFLAPKSGIPEKQIQLLAFVEKNFYLFDQ